MAGIVYIWHSEEKSHISSFINNKYLHFCTKEELEDDFQFLSIKELYEHRYDEPRACGETHHHISWILIASLYQ
jgi:hypothetical protein